MNNNKNKQTWTRLLTILFFLLGFFTFLTGSRVYNKTFKVKPHEITRKRFHERRLKQLEAYEHQRFMVESSKNRYNIEAIHIKSKIESTDVVILVHGIRSNYYDLLPTAFQYLDDGYNIILYNQRQSGLTGGKNSTFGLYEKFDLEEIATLAKRIYRDGKVGVHGFSMGAATAIMQSESNEETNLVDFYILDAPFHSMASAVELGAKRSESTKMPSWYVLFSGDTVLRMKQRVAYKDIVPLNVIHHTSRPVLLIHGEKDDVTSPDGSRQLFAAIHHNSRRLEIFPDEGHCTAHHNLKDDYFQRVYQFIADYL